MSDIAAEMHHQFQIKCRLYYKGSPDPAKPANAFARTPLFLIQQAAAFARLTLAALIKSAPH